MWYVLGGLLLALVAFIWWRYTSVERGKNQCREKVMQLLDPLGYKLAEKEPVSSEDVAALAKKAHVRQMLYDMLKYFERLDLFPSQYLDVKSQAESALAFWLMHPNELETVPEEMELVEVLTRSLDEQTKGDFFVFRYRMPAGHWAAKNGWLLGLGGPYVKDLIPYSVSGAFSRCGDKYGEVAPTELVDWYVGMVRKKLE